MEHLKVIGLGGVYRVSILNGLHPFVFIPYFRVPGFPNQDFGLSTADLPLAENSNSSMSAVLLQEIRASLYATKKAYDSWPLTAY